MAINCEQLTFDIDVADDRLLKVRDCLEDSFAMCGWTFPPSIAFIRELSERFKVLDIDVLKSWERVREEKQKRLDDEWDDWDHLA